MADNLHGCKNPLLIAERVYGDLCSIEKILQESGKEIELISKLEADLKVTELKVKVGRLLNDFETMGFSDENIPKLNTSPLGSDVIEETFWQKDDDKVDLIVPNGDIVRKEDLPKDCRGNDASGATIQNKPIRKISILKSLLRKEG